MNLGTRERILDGSLQVLRRGESVSLETAAREAGLTKPGLMYHFPTKEALMLGLVDYVTARWERHFKDQLATPNPSASERIVAYLETTLGGELDEADLVILSDPRLRDILTQRWKERSAPWVEIPEHIDTNLRGTLISLRLLADGIWFAGATGTYTLNPADRQLVRSAAAALLNYGLPAD